MAGLFPAEVVSATAHLRHNITVTDSRLCRIQSKLLSRFIEAEVAHHGGNYCAIFQFAGTIHGIAANTQNIIAIHFFPVLVNRDQPVSIPIESEA
ncbi:hypothetical protein D3C77_471730 [compost metagenome]